MNNWKTISIDIQKHWKWIYQIGAKKRKMTCQNQMGET